MNDTEVHAEQPPVTGDQIIEKYKNLTERNDDNPPSEQELAQFYDSFFSLPTDEQLSVLLGNTNPDSLLEFLDKAGDAFVNYRGEGNLSKTESIEYTNKLFELINTKIVDLIPEASTEGISISDITSSNGESTRFAIQTQELTDALIDERSPIPYAAELRYDEERVIRINSNGVEVFFYQAADKGRDNKYEKGFDLTINENNQKTEIHASKNGENIITVVHPPNDIPQKQIIEYALTLINNLQRPQTDPNRNISQEQVLKIIQSFKTSGFGQKI